MILVHQVLNKSARGLAVVFVPEDFEIGCKALMALDHAVHAVA